MTSNAASTGAGERRPGAIEPTAILTPDPPGLAAAWIETTTDLDYAALPPDLAADLTSCAARVLVLLGPWEGQP